MNTREKGRSPFYPGQPVPQEFFTGREEEAKIIARAINQVALGKPQAIFLTGEYGIGKSSLAGVMRIYAETSENKPHLLGIHIFLGGAGTLEDIAAKTVETMLKPPIYVPSVSEKIRNILAKYVGKQDIFGNFSINLNELKADVPSITNGFLPFLNEIYRRLEKDNIKGIMLILDEINGITKNPKFAFFIKTLIDENALSRNPLPLLLMLCGVEERRYEMIRHHQPVDRIFDIVKIKPMDDNEMKEFFNKTFGSLEMKLNNDALSLICEYSAGYPKFMHIIGNNIFWTDGDGIIDKNDAINGVIKSALEIGEKFVDKQVYGALRSKSYKSILLKLGKEDIDMSFYKKSIEKGLSEVERKNFNNFLQRMKDLNVIRSGEDVGEYVFNDRLVRFYIRLISLSKSKDEK